MHIILQYFTTVTAFSNNSRLGLKQICNKNYCVSSTSRSSFQILSWKRLMAKIARIPKKYRILLLKGLRSPSHYCKQ